MCFLSANKLYLLEWASKTVYVLVLFEKSHYSGSARVFGYTVYRGFLNRVYGILQLKYGYLVYHFL